MRCDCRGIGLEGGRWRPREIGGSFEVLLIVFRGFFARAFCMCGGLV